MTGHSVVNVCVKMVVKPAATTTVEPPELYWIAVGLAKPASASDAEQSTGLASTVIESLVNTIGDCPFGVTAHS